MKILKPGKVEQRKFVCQECGCTFVAYEADAYDDCIKCPQDGCERIISWKYDGEPYEEPVQTDEAKATKKRLYDILCYSATCRNIGEVATMLYDNGVTFKEM